MTLCENFCCEVYPDCEQVCTECDANSDCDLCCYFGDLYPCYKPYEKKEVEYEKEV